jgi:hypothetical protein
MAEGMQVHCRMTDCAHYRDLGVQGVAHCAQPDKEYYMSNRTCPLYKKGVEDDVMTAMIDRFKRKK